MAELVWNPKWQLNAPGTFKFNADGSVTFRGPVVGDVFLPDDYVAFMQKSAGAALRDRGSWFMARFDEGVVLLQIEWLGDVRSLMLGTWAFYETPEPETHKLPQKYVSIGYADPVNPNGADVVMNVVKDDPDFGKIYVWVKANDPWMTGDNTRGLGFVANSFTEFMNGLTEQEDL